MSVHANTQNIVISNDETEQWNANCTY